MLLRLRYQEPARQALAATLRRQLAVTGANGLSLTVQLRPPAPPPALLAHPLSAAERARLARNLNQPRRALNADSSKLAHDSTRLRLQLRAAPTAATQAHYQQLLEDQQRRMADFRQRRALYRRSLHRVAHGLPPVALATTPSPPASDSSSYSVKNYGLTGPMPSW